MTVSIIIAVKTWQRRLEECVAKCLELDFTDFEILVLPDSEQGLPPKESRQGLFPSEHEQGLSLESSDAFQAKATVPGRSDVPVRVIPTGPVSPGQKRDMALNYAKGEILAFIDDDAYPGRDWLKNAARNFSDPDVAAVGGPAVTPDSDNRMQKASGLVYGSFLMSGGYRYRYIPGKRREVDDYPSCNFLVRKEVMLELGGFNTKFWPGEDTKFCLEITKKLGRKIIYDPEVLVYHHRRPLFFGHLKQIASYALHRGYFVRRYPQTSLRVGYFIPSIFLLAIPVGGILALFFPALKIIYFAGLLLYLLLAVLASFQDIRLAYFIFSGIILSHLVYGLCFLIGLLVSRLKEERCA